MFNMAEVDEVVSELWDIASVPGYKGTYKDISFLSKPQSLLNVTAFN